MMPLERFATEIGTTSHVLPSGAPIRIPTLILHFPPANPPRLPEGVLKRTYTSKPLVQLGAEDIFGELALVRLLARDGWEALWADTFHGKFWQGMPNVSEPVRPPSHVADLYARVADRKGGPSGCFDVIAWRGERIVWVEYKGPGDRPNRNELYWLEAAIGAGVCDDDLMFVGEKTRRSTPQLSDHSRGA
jgi:hypothetical protein